MSSRKTNRTTQPKLLVHQSGRSPPCYVTIEEQIAWGGINRAAQWDEKLVRERQKHDMLGKGLGLVAHMLKALVARDVPVLIEHAVDSLIVEDQRVTGVRLADARSIRATRGVVVASGGYECNPDLMTDFDPLPGFQPSSPPSLTGDGLIFAAEIGAAIRRLQNNLSVMLGLTLTPDDGGTPIKSEAGIIELCSPHTIVVNRFGCRFADESFFQGMVPSLRNFDTMRHAYMNLPCYLIFDRSYTEAYSLAHLPVGVIPKSVTRAETLEALARTMAIDADGLQQTVRRFNGFATKGVDDDYHRGEMRWRMAKGANSNLGTINTPPYYAIELYPSLRNPSAGLLTDECGRVVHQRRHPIAGLYASGVVCARTEMGAGYQAGLNLASALTFSYLAVRTMLAEAPLRASAE